MRGCLADGRRREGFGQRLSRLNPVQYLCELVRSVRQRTQASRLGARLYAMPASGSRGTVRRCAPYACTGSAAAWPVTALWQAVRRKTPNASAGAQGSCHPRTRLFIADDRTAANVRSDLACARARRSCGGATSRAPSRCCLRWRLAPAAQSRKLHPRCPHRPAEALHLRRQSGRSRRAQRVLLVLLEEGYGITLRRAPEVLQACVQA